MRYSTLYVLAALLILLLCLTYMSDSVPVISQVDGRTYRVRQAEDKQAVADRLATIRQKLDRLITFAATSPKYQDDPRVRLLQQRWPMTIISETSTRSTDAAFTSNKGQHIAFCVRTGTGAIEDLNTSMFVALHELAHVATAGYNGHDDEFWGNMRFLLKIAIDDLGIYEYRPYEQQPTSYCGHSISRSPFTCYKDGTCSVK